jgi:hypothetical protein
MKIDEGRRFDDGMVWAAVAGVLLLCLFALALTGVVSAALLLMRECR